MSRSTAEQNWPWLQKGFATTRWSLLKRVALHRQERSQSSEEFCRLYWHPLYSFLRKRGLQEAECQDHVQSFLMRAINERFLEKADPQRGKFRSYLTSLLIRHVSAAFQRGAAQKRGGFSIGIPMDWDSAEREFQNLAGINDSPEDVLRRALAVGLVQEAFVLLRESSRKSGAGKSAQEQSRQESLLEQLIPALEGQLVDGTYQEVALKLSMSVGAVRVAVIRLRARFRECLRSAASAALRMPAGPALDEELRELFR